MTALKRWHHFVKEQEESIGPEAVRRWLAPLLVKQWDSQHLELEAADAFQREWFEEHIRPRLEGNFRNRLGKSIRVTLTLRGGMAREANGRKKKGRAEPVAAKQLLERDTLDPHCTFDHYFVSEANLLVHKILSQLAPSGQEESGSTHSPAQLVLFNPIYLYGSCGTGKTHLLMAAAHALAKAGYKAVYVRLETFTNHMVLALRAGEMGSFRQAYRDCDALLIDDIDLLARRSTTQEELFHTFNSLHLMGKQIILAASSAPQQLQQIEPRLISRFEWGVVLPLQLPTPKELLVVLRLKAAALGVPLSARLEEFLITTFSRHPKELCTALEALLLRLHLENQEGGKPVSAERARALLVDLVQQAEQSVLKPGQLLSAVAEKFGMRVDELTGRGQSREMAQPRQLAMYLCRELLKLPFVKIGELFDRDHSTVMTSVRQIEQRLKDPQDTLTADYGALIKKLAP